MSSALAIAAVTAVLKDLLDNGLIDHDVPAQVGDVSVTALPLDRIPTDANERSQLNLFLYRVTPNTAWRNMGMPSRDARGARLTNPPLALDLHYLLTAFGAQDFHTDILLGYGMQLFHETPVLTREAIRRALRPPLSVDPGDALPPHLKLLDDAELDEQAELIKITPESLSTEEISKLWAAFQARYRPTAAYLVTVVLIQSKGPARSPLPVLQPVVDVRPNLLPPVTLLTAALPPDEQPSLRPVDDGGELEVLTIQGYNLDRAADEVVVRFRSGRLETPNERPPASLSGTAITLTLLDNPGDDPSGWPAGVYTVSVVYRTAGQPDLVTNELPLAIAPRVTAISAQRQAPDDVAIEVHFTPPVRPVQNVSLLLGGQEIPSPAHESETDELTFHANVAPGTYRVRLRVDGVETLLVDRSQKPPRYRTGPTYEVTIP